MPELPEVECTRRTLEPHLVGRVVASVGVRRRDVVVVPGDPAGGFSRARGKGGVTPRRLRRADLLVGDRVARTARRGKQLAVIGESGRMVLVHLGMTGQLSYLAPGSRPAGDAHVHVVWTLKDSRGEEAGRLVFRDPRRFGGVWALPDLAALERRWAALGPDGLTLTGSELARGLAGTRRAVKAALLDQGVVAGVGNIYADEALFLAGIHPLTPGADLDGAAVERLAGAIRRVLREGIEAGGSTLRDYVDGLGRAGTYQTAHRVYGRGGEACVACGGVLESLWVGQRTTVACPTCQPRGGGRRRSAGR